MILVKELRRDSSFREAWSEAQDLYPEKHLLGGDVMDEESYLAVISYTLETPNVCKEFNALCREAEAAEWSWEIFPFKSLWYFLIRAFEKL
ncbi:hypothetical protein IscW_ISCW020654 [Ixodes scapularis]|uniref:NAD(P)(+)--arginine ADP-ribosyltransferase n=1 Tax=Ixodes scapularis TaxID=6945 RepID=B7Q2P7_IXOSC|nr:hypothetical protein IscW_ISCW020654 [Ixodes scapularis]|eukprot:XP_002410927.1 hypothetical protein IscW_ISCW020654 [Ixodes scapularis]